MIRKISKKAFSTSAKLEVFSPYSNQLVYEIGYKSLQDANLLLQKASKAQKTWARSSLDERILLCRKIMDYFEHVEFFKIFLFLYVRLLKKKF
jgi:acyl-CoA reductase-like NAD-dependent aldehyde dehydrogenase